MWLVIVSNAIPIHYPALMVLKIHKSDNIITLATETWNQQSILLLFGMFMTYSTSYCHSDKLMDPRNVCMSVTQHAWLNAVIKTKPEFECRPVTSTEFINSGLVSNSTVQYHD